MILRIILLVYQYALGSVCSHIPFINLSTTLMYSVFHLHLNLVVEQGYYVIEMIVQY
jgi:hypothetical protein